MAPKSVRRKKSEHDIEGCQSTLARLASEFQSPSRDSDVQSMLMKMDNVREAQQKLCSIHFDMEGGHSQQPGNFTASAQGTGALEFDSLISNLKQLDESIKQLHPTTFTTGPNEDGLLSPGSKPNRRSNSNQQRQPRPASPLK